MARYIDADDLKDIITVNRWSNHAMPDVIGVIIDRTPTADVVPRAEVEYWKEQCFNACMNNGFLDETIVRAAVAREIFEDIEDALDGNYCGDYEADYPIPHYLEELKDDIAELKKKYTEETNDN